MLEHPELIEELDRLREMSVGERLRHARIRRDQQLRNYRAHQSSAPPTRRGHVTISRGGKRSVRFDVKTMLFEAVTRNDVDEVSRILLEKNCDKNMKNEDGLTLVHQACIEGNIEMLRVLVMQFGCDLTIADNEMWTPLHTVALCGYHQLASFLIHNGANTLSLNVDSNMPYDICDDDVTLNIIEQNMAQNGITQHLIESLRQEPEHQLFDLIISNKKSITSGTYAETPMHIAATHGYIQVLSYLIATGANIHAKDLDLWQPIHCAAYWKKLVAIELLILNGADLTSVTNEGETSIDLCNDEQVRQWMWDLQLSKKSKFVPLPSLNYQQKTSSHKNTASHYDSAVSISQMNLLTCSSKRVISSNRDERLKQSGHDEFISSLLSIDAPLSTSTATINRKNYQVPVISNTNGTRSNTNFNGSLPTSINPYFKRSDTKPNMKTKSNLKNEKLGRVEDSLKRTNTIHPSLKLFDILNQSTNRKAPKPQQTTNQIPTLSKSKITNKTSFDPSTLLIKSQKASNYRSLAQHNLPKKFDNIGENYSNQKPKQSFIGYEINDNYICPNRSKNDKDLSVNSSYKNYDFIPTEKEPNNCRLENQVPSSFNNRNGTNAENRSRKILPSQQMKYNCTSLTLSKKNLKKYSDKHNAKESKIYPSQGCCIIS